MKKIKNFKIDLRRGYIQRELRKKNPDSSVEDMEKRIEETQQGFQPATVYETFPSCVLDKVQGMEKAVSVSVIALTLGDIAATVPKDDIYDAIIKDAFDFSLDFVIKLITIESEKEECELSCPAEFLPDKVFSVPAISDSMEFSKIGICFSEGKLSPVLTKIFGVGWFPKKKKR